MPDTFDALLIGEQVIAGTLFTRGMPASTVRGRGAFVSTSRLAFADGLNPRTLLPRSKPTG